MSIIITSRFKRDVKLAQKRKYDVEKLKELIVLLHNHETLSYAHRDHQLKGQLSECRECHIGPDWLLIYRYDGDDLILERTGSHSDLFK